MGAGWEEPQLESSLQSQPRKKDQLFPLDFQQIWLGQGQLKEMGLGLG